MELRSSKAKRSQSEAGNANIVTTSKQGPTKKVATKKVQTKKVQTKKVQTKKRKAREGEDHTESMKSVKSGRGLLEDMVEVPMESVVDLYHMMKRQMLEGEDHTESMKSVKSGRGLLKDMVEMPMDVLLEIFGQLEPLDLLSIGRTTKALRAILMSRSSKSVWMSARSNVFGLPDCPDDLSEPQYAALVFAKACTFCQRIVPGIHIFWYARVRCCAKCTTLNFTPASRRPSGDRGCPALLTDWVPFVKLKRTPTETLYISVSTDNQWKDEYWACKDPNSQHEWLLRTVRARYLIQKHARACAFWHNAWSNSKEGTDLDKLRSILKQNNAKDLAYVQGISVELEEELGKVPPAQPYPPESPKYQFLSWNQLWSILQDPKLPDHRDTLSFVNNSLPTMLRESKRHRESLTRRDLLTSRKPFISAIYNNGVKTLPINSLSPTIGQFYCFAEDRDLIDYSVTAEAALRIPFDEVIALWKKRLDGKLIDLIASACGTEHKFDTVTVLDLATTFFRCQSCYDSNTSLSMRRDDAIAHLCDDDHVFRSAADPYQDHVFGSAGWKHGGMPIEFSLEDMKTMQKVVKMCGLNPKVTTAPQMDELNPIFECLDCSSVEKGRATMSWTAVLRHQRETRHSAPPQTHTLRLLGEPEAIIVRKCIKAEEMRLRYQNYFWCAVVCPHCRSVLDRLKYYQHHLKEEHEISKMNYEELIYSNTQCWIPPEYRLFLPSSR